MKYPRWMSLSQGVSHYPEIILPGAAALGCVGAGACLGAYLFFAVGTLINAAQLIAPSDVATKVALMMSTVGYGVVGAGAGIIVGASAVPMVLRKLKEALAARSPERLP